MSMALKADVMEACKCAGTEKPIDLVHLSRLTMGDRALELEVLKMFLAQIPQYIEMIKAAKTDQETYAASHTIKGAASSVGAFRLADLARSAEKSGMFDFQAFIQEMAQITDYVSMLSAQD